MSVCMQQRAYVVFTGKTSLRRLKILRPGFRHCFVLLCDGRRWLSLDPLSSYMNVLVHDLDAQFDFPLYMRRRGYLVVPAAMRRPGVQAPAGLFSCVEAVKRVLGIHNARIITPWQLYRHITKKEIHHG